MTYLFIIACLVICLLVFLMFLILKKTVKKINTQTRLYFVDKSQEYDYLIKQKVDKLNQLDKEIKEKEANKKETVISNNKQSYDFDYSIINLLNNTEYQNRNIFELNKEIDNKFSIDYISLIKKFVTLTKSADNQYSFCNNIKKKFTSDMVYKLKIMSDLELNNYLKKTLSDDEYKIYKLFTETNTNPNIDNFINYLNELIDLNNPLIVVYVGDKNENYDYLSDNIKTIYSTDIYKGIKIKYQNKIYDYSLNERNV